MPIQDAWWRGYSDAYQAIPYRNIYVGRLLTDAYEYQQGYLCGASAYHRTGWCEEPPGLRGANGNAHFLNGGPIF